MSFSENFGLQTAAFWESFSCLGFGAPFYPILSYRHLPVPFFAVSSSRFPLTVLPFVWLKCPWYNFDKGPEVDNFRLFSHTIALLPDFQWLTGYFILFEYHLEYKLTNFGCPA